MNPLLAAVLLAMMTSYASYLPKDAGIASNRAANCLFCILTVTTMRAAMNKHCTLTSIFVVLLCPGSTVPGLSSLKEVREVIVRFLANEAPRLEASSSRSTPYPDPEFIEIIISIQMNR